jgi:hypothetical protein
MVLVVGFKFVLFSAKIWFNTTLFEFENKPIPSILKAESCGSQRIVMPLGMFKILA